MYNRDEKYNYRGDRVFGWREQSPTVALSAVEKRFIDWYNSIPSTIELRSDWDNGNGYFTNAVNKTKDNGRMYVRMYPGELRKCLHTSRRRMIFVGTELGTVVFFEAKSPGNHDNRITFSACADLLESGILKYSDVETVERFASFIIGTSKEPAKMTREIEVYVRARASKENKAKVK